MRKRLLIRFVVIALALGGVYLFQRGRKPADLSLAVDLSGARPKEITGIDVVIRRGGRPLSRHEMSFGGSGAPSTLEFVVHAAPGNADVESTLNYQGRPSRRTTVQIDLQPEGSNRLRIE
jgi:hypothetical protein